MGIELTPGRQWVQQQDHNVRAEIDGNQAKVSQQRDWGIFRSSDTAASNKAQFARFLDVLRADPNYRNEGSLADLAFASIERESRSGQPLTSRLMARAYESGDALLQKKQAAETAARDQFVQHLVSRVNDRVGLDRLIDKVSGGQLRDFSSKVPQHLLNAAKADILDAVRAKVPTGRDLAPNDLKGSAVDARIEAAIAKHLDKLTAMPTSTAVAPGKLHGLGSQRIAPIVDQLHTFGEMRMGARLFASAGASARFEQEVMRTMADKIGRLDNQSLLGQYRDLLSADMTEFRLKLALQPDNPGAQAMLADLNSWEGMVHSEVAERVARGLDPDGDAFQHGLESLGQAERRASKKEMAAQSDAWLSGTSTQRSLVNNATAQRLQGLGVTVEQLVQTLRASDLTINIPPSLFVRSGHEDYRFEVQYNTLIESDGSIVTDKQRLKNIFELDPSVKGQSYLDKRQLIESQLFPELEKHDSKGIDPRRHPISSALNFARNVGGGASGGGYGGAVLVLKDDVRQRTAFTPRDAFYATESRIDRAGVDRFAKSLGQALQGSAQLSEDARNLLMSPSGDGNMQRPPVSLILQRLEEARESGLRFGVGQAKSLEDFVGDTLLKGIGLKSEDVYAVVTLAIAAFTDLNESANHVTTTDRLASLIEDLDDKVLGDLAKAATDSQRINLGTADYIEAEVFGGVDLTRDIKEIRFPNMPDSFPEEIRNLKALSQELGIPLVLFDTEEASVSRLNTDESIKASFPVVSNDAVDKTQKGGLKSFKENVLPKLLDAYKSHEQSFDPTGIHGRRHVSRALIYSNVLANILREHGAQIDSHALYTTTVLHDSGREGNGVDLWEKDSAALCRKSLEDMGIDDEDYLKRATACIDSKASASQKTLEGAILKSADSLDIIRVYGREGFRPDLLWFMHQDVKLGEDRYLKVDETLRTALIDEVAGLIEMTEPRSKKEMECNALRDRMLLEADPDKQEKMQAEIRKLNLEVAKEYQSLNSALSNEDLFAGIEKALLDHPKKFPILHKYYDTSK